MYETVGITGKSLSIRAAISRTVSVTAYHLHVYPERLHTHMFPATIGLLVFYDFVVFIALYSCVLRLERVFMCFDIIYTSIIHY
ncbi:hypothetical protein Trydic_g10579 [Trypoxylus dichotomus]